MTNFGGEVSFRPKSIFAPKTEEDLLGILDSNRGDQIRAIGSLHSWNKGMVSSDVLIDLSNFDGVRLEKDSSGNVIAEVGGGCTLAHLISELEKSNVTLPTLGAIERQTISGAISTGTHGSGKSSLSNYMEELRIAAYDESGKAVMRTVRGGKELQAARCSVGCMGVIVSAKFRTLPEYWIEEKDSFYTNIGDVLSKEKEFPQQEFLLIPYDWRYFSFQRRETEKHESLIKRKLVNFFDFLTFELGTHLLLKAVLFLSSLLDSMKLIPGFYTSIVPAFLSPKTYVNKSSDALTLHTLHHYLFRHLEMELFVPEENIVLADRLIRDLTMSFADKTSVLPDDTAQALEGIGMFHYVTDHRGYYQHHYPFFFRSVSSDDTLISMTSGGKRYSISFFTYLSPEKREHYYEFAECMAYCLTELCDARLHWGKYYPLSNEQTSHLYPHIEEFRRISSSYDPQGNFQNDFTRRTIGFNK